MTVTFTESELDQFTGSEHYYRSSPFTKGIVHTDGVQHIVTHGGAWMVDVITSHQTNPKVHAAEFQSWKFIVNADDSSCRVMCEDGMNDYDTDKPLVTQEIEYTDLPFNVQIFVELGSLDMETPAWVILLPSEH